jgi:translocation and assembly module TamB
VSRPAKHIGSKHWRVSRPVRVIAYAFGALLMAYFILVIVFSTSWFKRTVLERTRTRLEAITGARVEIGAMQINPWVLQLTFRNMVMHGSETGREPPLFSVRTLVLRANPRALIQRRVLRLTRLDLEDAAIHIYTRADGSTNLPGPAAQSGSRNVLDDLLDLDVAHLLVAQSSFSWDDRQWPLQLSAQGLAVAIGARRQTYSGSISAELVALSNPDFSLPAVAGSTRLVLARNSLQLQNLVWRSPGLSGGGDVSLQWVPSLESAFSLHAAGDVSPVARVLLRTEIRQGTFSADSQGTYRDGALDARGHMDVRHFLPVRGYLGSNPLEIASDYRIEGRDFRLTRLTASLLGGRARGDAEISYSGRTPSYKAGLDLQDFDLGRSIALLPHGREILSDFPVASRASGRIDVSGSAAKAESRFDLRLDPSGALVGREPLTGFIRGVANFNARSSVELEAAVLRTSHSALKFSGSVDPSNCQLRIQMQSTDFGEWKKPAEFIAERPLPVELNSTASFSGTLTGPAARPMITGHFQVGSFEYQSWKWTGMQADVAAGPSQLRLTSGRLLGPRSTLTFQSTVSLQDWQYAAGDPFEVSARAAKTSIQGLREVLGVQAPVSGDVSGELQVSENHSDLDGGASFLITSGSYAGETFDSLNVGVSVEGGTWKLTHFSLKKSRGEMTARGSFDRATRHLFAHAHGDGFSLTGFHRLQDLALGGNREGLKGTIAFDLDVEGGPESKSAHGNVNVQNLAAGDITLGDLTGQLATSGDEATLQGQLHGPGGVVDFHGSSRMGSLQNLDWPLKVSAHYTGLRLDPWMRALGMSPLIGTVDTTGSFDYSGTLRDGGPAEIKSEIQNVNVKFAGLQWSNDHPFDVSLQRQRVEITPFSLRGPSTEFRLQGSADLAPVPALDLRAEGQIDAQFLHIFDPALLTRGRFTVQIKVQGSFRQPLLYGSLKVDQVSIGYPGLPLRLAGLNGDVDLQGDRLTIRSLRAENGPATVAIGGSATLSGTPRYNLRADFSHLRVAYPVQFVSVVSGGVRLSGTPGAGVLSGDVTVEQMFVSQNFNVLNWASELANQPAETLEGSSPLSSAVRMDVHVSSAPTVSVESHGLSAVAAIDLSLRGTLADPIVFGNVHIQSGQAVLRQTNYKLSHGDVIMANPLRTEPVLDLEATTRIQQYELVLRITGPADRPNISYRSDPPLSTPSILALLAFGYSTQDQMMANTGRSSFSTQGASALLSQALSSQVSSRVTRLFGLSRISIDPNPISTGGTQVTVEEQLARDFTITYVTTTGGIVERIIRVEWDLSDTVSLLGIRDQNGVYGFELDFRRRFK